MTDFQHQNPFRIVQSVVLSVISVTVISFINRPASLLWGRCEMQWKCVFLGGLGLL